jgi:hypothetical protein
LNIVPLHIAGGLVLLVKAGVGFTVTVPVTWLPVQVMPEATSCGVTVIVYVFAELLETVMEEVVELPVNPPGNDHE